MEENREEMLEKIEEMAEQKRFAELKSSLAEENPADLAALFEELAPNLQPLIFRLLPKELAADTFAYLDNDIQESLIEAFNDKELQDVVNLMYLDDTVDMIEEMPANVVKRILKHARPETRKMINEILKYPEDSAGSIMTIEYVDLRS